MSKHSSQIQKTDLEISSYESYDGHSAVMTFIDPVTKIQGFISFYRTHPVYPAFGATRIWNYHSLREGLEDSLRLAKTMMYKNAMAGTYYGGAKGVLVADMTALSPEKRKGLLERYAHFVNFLGGYLVTGADVGMSPDDVKVMKEICKKYIVGTKVDPVQHTVNGLISCLKEALNEVYGTPDIEGRSFAIQGAGKTGSLLMDHLYGKAKKIYITDINKASVDRLMKKHPNIIYVDPQDIYKQKVDVFSPCALGGILNENTLKMLQADIVLGTANDQLADRSIGKKLHMMGILYGPDYVVNGGGVMSVIHEYENSRIQKKELADKVDSIGDTLKKVISHSKKHSLSMIESADQMAEKVIKKNYAI